MTKLKLILLAIPALFGLLFALLTPAARRILNLLPVLAFVGFAAFLTACGGSLTGGGIGDKYVNEALPEKATIYTATIDKAGDTNITPGTEAGYNTDLVWNAYSGIVPCSDIKGVDYFIGGENNGEILLPLASCKYGCKYYPQPPRAGSHWTRPSIPVDADFNKNTDGDFTQAEAQHLANHCGVPFQVRGDVGGIRGQAQTTVRIATENLAPPGTTINTNAPLTAISGISAAITNTLSDGGFNTNYLLLGGGVIGGGFALASGGGGGNNSPFTPTPTAPTRLEVTAPELAGAEIYSTNGSYWFFILPARAEGENTIIQGQNINIQRQGVTRIRFRDNNGVPFQFTPQFDVAHWHATGMFRAVFQNGFPTTLRAGRGQIIFGSRPDITQLAQLCPARWLGNHINRYFGSICVYPSDTSYSPNIARVIGAAMADGFDRGFAIGDSAFAFSGRYDGDNRAAGFTYDLGGYALRTDYIRLPSRQDSEVWLDTYRFGALSRVNDEVQFFAGVDNYRNAIIAIDASGENAHRLGFAVGDGYAVKYEYRLNL